METNKIVTTILRIVETIASALLALFASNVIAG